MAAPSELGLEFRPVELGHLAGGVLDQGIEGPVLLKQRGQFRIGLQLLLERPALRVVKRLVEVLADQEFSVLLWV